MISLSFWGISLGVVAFVPQADNILLGYILTGVMGIGLGGSLYLYDQGLAVTIDDDAARSGLRIRREGAYYGVVAFFNRFSTGINLGIIAIVFQRTGWETYVPRPGINTQLGIRSLIGIWPIVVIIVALICLYFWPIHGERYEENKRIIEEMRLENL
jgi:Na+/melibiose symporter-like transporter